MEQTSTNHHGASVSARTPVFAQSARTSSQALTNPKIDQKSRDSLPTMTADLESIRAKATCNICIRLLYEPYTLGCGHTFCYSCLCQWFDGKKMNKTCPECRSKVTERPAPAYLVKDIVEIFINRLDMMPAGETVEQHRKWRSEDVKLVERDKANTDRKTGGLFRGAFSSKPRLHAFRDEGDGVHRCPLCAWELEDGRCEQCGVAVDSEGLVVSDDDEEDTDSFPSSVGSAFNNARRANRTMDRSRRGRTGRSQTSESEASPMRHDHPWHLAALERMARQPVPIVDEDMVSMTGEDDMIMDDEVDDVDDDDEEDEDEASWLSSSMRDFLDDDDSDHSTNADSLAADRASNVPAVSVRSGQTDTDSRDHAGTHNVQSSVAVQIDDSDEEGTISTNTRRARATPRLYVMSRRGTRAMRVAVSSSSDTEPDDGDLGVSTESVSDSRWSPLDMRTPERDIHTTNPENGRATATSTARAPSVRVLGSIPASRGRNTRSRQDSNRRTGNRTLSGSTRSNNSHANGNSSNAATIGLADEDSQAAPTGAQRDSGTPRPVIDGISADEGRAITHPIDLDSDSSSEGPVGPTRQRRRNPVRRRANTSEAIELFA